MAEIQSYEKTLNLRRRRRVDYLVCGLPLVKRKKRILMFLTVFCDDSGSDTTTPLFVLAGYASDVDSWNRFSDEWQQALDSSPRLNYFKMKEAESRRGEFWGWNTEDLDKKVLQLTEIIRRNVRFGIGSFLAHSAYEAHARGQLPPTVDSPYWLCFYGILNGVLNIAKDVIGDGKIDFVFDVQGDSFERRAGLAITDLQELFQSLSHPYGNILGGVSFHHDHDVLPLQAADMLAWHIRRHSHQAIRRAPEVRPIAEVLWSIPTITKGWMPNEIEDFVTRYNKYHPESPQNRGLIP